MHFYEVEVLGGEGIPTEGGWALEIRTTLKADAERVYAECVARYGEELVAFSAI